MSNTKININELIEQIASLTERIIKLEAQLEPKRNEAQREMTDDDAKQILFGDLANDKHNSVASILGLSYGQIYSCRKEFTFKHIHKHMKDNSIVNIWMK